MRTTPKTKNKQTQSRRKTSYPLVYERECKGAAGKMDTAYYIIYEKNGKRKEESVGRKNRDGITAAKASAIRLERIAGKELSNHEPLKGVRRASGTKEGGGEEAKRTRMDIRQTLGCLYRA